MRYAMARYLKERRDLAYRVYVTDGIALSVQGKYITQRFIDVVNPPPEDARPAMEIAQDILSRAGLEVTSN